MRHKISRKNAGAGKFFDLSSYRLQKRNKANKKALTFRGMSISPSIIQFARRERHTGLVIKNPINDLTNQAFRAAASLISLIMPYTMFVPHRSIALKGG